MSIPDSLASSVDMVFEVLKQGIFYSLRRVNAISDRVADQVLAGVAGLLFKAAMTS